MAKVLNMNVVEIRQRKTTSNRNKHNTVSQWPGYDLDDYETGVRFLVAAEISSFPQDQNSLWSMARLQMKESWCSFP